MRLQDAKSDLRFILSLFSEVFSRPSFKLFNCFVTGFIRFWKGGSYLLHGSIPQPPLLLHLRLIRLLRKRSLSSFTGFLGKNVWSMEEITRIKLEHFFQTLHIKAQSVPFLLIDDTLVKKSGKEIPGCSWYRDPTQKRARVFGHQWVLLDLLYRDFLFPLWAKLYHPKGTRECGPFHTKINMANQPEADPPLAERIVQSLKLPTPCKLYLLMDSWYWSKELVNYCRRKGYHVIFQLKSNSILWMKGKKAKLQSLLSKSLYREVSLHLFRKSRIRLGRNGENRTLQVAKRIGEIQGIGKVAVVGVKEKRKKPVYLVSTNLYISPINVVEYYAKRWKI